MASMTTTTSKRGAVLFRRSKLGLVPLGVVAFLLGCPFIYDVYRKPTSSSAPSPSSPNDESRRNLQLSNPFSSIFNGVSSFFETVFPFFRPNEYTLQPISSFVIHYVCTDAGRPGCNEFNTITFTNSAVVNPPPNGFRYHDSGPLQLQGVFWTQQNAVTNSFPILKDSFPASQLVSFARTRHGNGVQSGVIETDSNGYEFVARVLGDHSWGFRENVVDTFASAPDSLYLFQLTEGTNEDPRRFEIYLSFKLWYNCLRYNFRELINIVFRNEQILITDPNDPRRLKYPGSQVWLRRSRYASLISMEYLAVQIVDGFGQRIQPAYNEFAQDNHVVQVTGLLPDQVNVQQTC